MAARRVEPGSTLARQRPNEENMSRSSVALIELLGLEREVQQWEGRQRGWGESWVQHGGTRRSRHVVCFVLWLVEGLFGDSVRCRVGYDVWREFSNGYRSRSKKKNLSHAFKFLPPIFLSPQTPFHEIQNNRRSGHTLHRPMLVVTCRGWDLGHHGPVHRPHTTTPTTKHGRCNRHPIQHRENTFQHVPP